MTQNDLVRMFSRGMLHKIIHDDCEILSCAELAALRPDMAPHDSGLYAYGINGNGDVFRFGLNDSGESCYLMTYLYVEKEQYFAGLSYDEAASRAEIIQASQSP